MKAIFDAARATARTVDANGFMHVKGCPITSAGVFDYARSEVDLPGDPNELVKVSRPLATVIDPAFLASCQNMPIVYLHTYVEGVLQDSSQDFSDDAQGMDPDKKGVVGVMTNVYFDEASGWVVADLTFYSRSLIRQLMSGVETELSLGYTSKIQTADEGDEVAAYQVTMCCNHLAVVDKARVHGARVLDSAAPSSLSEDCAMKKKMLDGAAVDKLRELLLPALTQFLSESAAAEPAAAEPATAEPGAVVATDPATDPAAGDVPAEGESEAAEVAEVTEAGEPAIVAEDDDADVSALIKQLIAALSPAAEVGDGEEDQKCGDDMIEGVEGLDAEADTEEAPVMTMDAMFVAIAERDKLADRLSRVVGVFDHATMTLDKVAAYGVKKLGLTHKIGDSQVVLLGAYLSGVEAANAKTITVKAADSAVETEIDAYLAGKK